VKEGLFTEGEGGVLIPGGEGDFLLNVFSILKGRAGGKG
jgi:hypothetical protein